MVVYEMHTRTFPDVPTGDDTLFDELLSPTNVDYLHELGVNTLLILPTAEFPGDVSWGYNPAHIFAVESSYGGPRKFKEFVDRAHGNGFAVLLDVVYNHFGPNDIEHVWQFDGWHQEWDGRRAASTSTTTGARARRGARRTGPTTAAARCASSSATTP